MTAQRLLPSDLPVERPTAPSHRPGRGHGTGRTDGNERTPGPGGVQHAGAVHTTRQRVGWARLGLPARVALAWALGAGILTAMVGGSSYSLVRRYLLLQRTEVTTRQAYSNARVVRDTLRNPSADLAGLLATLRSDAGSFPLVRYHGSWFGTPAGTGPETLPADFRRRLGAGESGRQRFVNQGAAVLAVGVVMPSVDAQYVEVFPLDTLRHTLALLRNSLMAGTLVALATGAFLGAWSARRVLRPVTRVAEAAEALARGALDTRLASERDVDLNRLVTSFNTMVDAVQRRIEREARFASDVSHELRTPLGALSAATQVLERRRDELPERAQQAVDVITSQLRRLSTMVLDLLEIARIDAGVADVHLEEDDLSSLLGRVADGLGVPRSLLQVAPGTGPAHVMIDRRRFEQIMRNLVDNAGKYGGGVTRIGMHRDGGDIVVVVDDAGPGVSSAERQRIFERFARGRSAQDIPGTGLGLALAMDQAALLGGTVSASSSPEGGARFSVRLPEKHQMASAG